MTLRNRRLLAGLVLATVIVAGLWNTRAPDEEPAVVQTQPNPARTAYEANRSEVEMTVQGAVVRILPDDDDGSRHQRFVVDVGEGHTLLISHNIDLASRVPVRVGSSVTARGVYVWNDRGGLLHWTHHDPDGQRTGGWIEFGGVRIR